MPDFGVKRFDYVIKHYMYNIDFLVTNKDIPDIARTKCFILFDNEGNPYSVQFNY